MFGNYRELKVWQMAMDLTMEVYRLTRSFPVDERFGLVSQMNRAAVSIPSNIAEGHGRNSTGEYIQFLGVARGSLCELETQLEIARRLGFIPTEIAEGVFEKCVTTGKLLVALLNSLRRKNNEK